ncbi:MAG: sorbosone dehydrogenase family protein [Kordiimonadaceae bacterium]|jgi:glucose/arabinose dehydrogenase|nr:sorbosone dehydrogenase family protein [Kordiimonadaceae bacterium]MBT6037372.1 sorbosone dehydrogenase family protein [Kordiimonadaceae bacterium]MBT6329139.1 sorbosone dehydrogenase family protein [Kordiimonadaceae bacterium]MBT7582173.1 sorbosone dehydrogenase family protein [Kordiimonadaceae bacterium]
MQKLKLILTSLLITSFIPAITNAQDTDLDKLVLPDGFSIEVYAKVRNARQMSLGDDGTVYVGTRNRAGGRIFAVPDANGDGKGDEVITIAGGLKSPSGLTYHNGDLYIGAISRIYRIKDIANNFRNDPDPEILYGDLPDKTHHGWKFLEFGPDGLLYIPIGAPCNICEPEDVFASINTMDVNNPDAGITQYASGIRNTVGFDWDPNSGDLWFTDNGGDGLGDEMPADELNRAPTSGHNFGYPYIHQGDTQDPNFGDGKNAANYTPPAQKLAPHAGAIGMTFYKGDMFPAKYKNNIIIAEHGSWNRTDEAGHTGHMLTLVTVEDGKAVNYEPFITGFLQDNEAWGRPSDVLELKDGSLLIADDDADAIYRVTYGN